MNAPIDISEPSAIEKMALACIHCGLCLSSCPTYLETGNENQSPRGRIYLMRALEEGRAVEEEVVGQIDGCLGCRACEAVCPSGVEYGALLEETRNRIEKRYRRPLRDRIVRRFLIGAILPRGRRLRTAIAAARIARESGLGFLLPGSVRDLLDAAPDTASIPRRTITIEKRDAAPGTRAGLLTGCVADVLFGETNTATARLLSRAGYDTVVPEGQVCCGALFAHGGEPERARELARINIAAFERSGTDMVVVNAAGCGSMLKEYGALLREDPAWRDRAARFSAGVRDLTEVVAGIDLPGDATISKHDTTRADVVTYHDACHLAHAQRITREPREALRRAGGRFVELPESDVCCGSAGSYSLTEPEMSARLRERKIANILTTGASIVVTSNPGCILQIRAGLLRKGITDVEVLHIADYLARRLDEHVGAAGDA